MKIYFERKKKLYLWDYKKCFRNIAMLILAILLIFLFGYAGRLEYNDYINSYKYQVESGKIEDTQQNYINFMREKRQ